MTKNSQDPANQPTHPIDGDESLAQHETQDGRSKEVLRHQQPLSRLGKYEIKERLGSGGMGEVYRAYDASLNRFVALKILYADNPDSIRRFLEEARIQAGIEHENICKVYEAGQEDGKNYIAMQLIKGKTLLEAARQMNEEQKLAVLCQAADAMQASHQKGLIHRDIKPTNIMVEQNENGDWKPFICDFGLARGTEAPNLTMTGMILGTPPYMAPEQARSETKMMDARTDVYALGATLYEILSGKPIYEGKNPAEILVKILDDEPPPVRNSNPALPQDLQTIILRCVEKNPEQRYQSARSLAEDLRRYLQNEPILARQTTRSYRWIRKARKNKTATITLGISAILILVGIAFFLQSQANAKRQAKLIAEFGNEVRFIESQLRSAYAAPLHDVRGQTADIKKRLKQIEERISSEGKPAYGPGYEALGQSYIAIGDYKKAQEFLEKAWKAGYQEPSTAYALGIATGKSYQDELLKAERLPSAGIRERKRKEAEEKYGRKAVDYLKKGRTHTESTLYVEALTDFYEKRFESALKKSRDAFRLTSWPYESKKLEGDIYLEIGKQAQQSGDHKKAADSYASAGKAYSEAEELARSSEEIHLALGQRFNAEIQLQYATGVRDENYFSKALEACNKALIANPDSGKGYLCLSEAYYREGINTKFWSDKDPTALFLSSIQMAERAEKTNHSVDALVAASESYVSLAERAVATRKDPLPYLQKAIQKAERAEKLDQNSDAFHSLAGAYFLLGDYQLFHGQDPTPALQKVVQIYHEGRKDVSLLEYMQNILGLAYLDMGEYKFQRGEDPYSEFNKSLKHLKRGLELNPKAHYIASNIGLDYSRLAAFDISQGRNPKQNCTESLRYYDISMAGTPDAAPTHSNKGLVYLLLAEYELLSGNDPKPELTSAMDHFQTGIKLNAELNFIFINMATASRMMGEYKILTNQDPAAELKEAEQNLQKALQSSEDFYEAHRSLGEIHILKARHELLQKRSPSEKLISARKAISESLRINPLDAISYVDMAQTYRWEALSNEKLGQQAAEAGLDWIQKSKEKKLMDARLIALEGLFSLIQARHDQDPKKRASVAVEFLEKAVKMNPLLKTEYTPFLEQANKLKR
jgi:serine/threonine-protein kinase